MNIIHVVDGINLFSRLRDSTNQSLLWPHHTNINWMSDCLFRTELSVFSCRNNNVHERCPSVAGGETPEIYLDDSPRWMSAMYQRARLTHTHWKEFSKNLAFYGSVTHEKKHASWAPNDVIRLPLWDLSSKAALRLNKNHQTAPHIFTQLCFQSIDWFQRHHKHCLRLHVTRLSR